MADFDADRAALMYDACRELAEAAGRAPRGQEIQRADVRCLRIADCAQRLSALAADARATGRRYDAYLADRAGEQIDAAARHVLEIVAAIRPDLAFAARHAMRGLDARAELQTARARDAAHRARAAIAVARRRA